MLHCVVVCEENYFLEEVSTQQSDVNNSSLPVFLLQNTSGSFDGNMNNSDAINIAGTASLTNL